MKLRGGKFISRLMCIILMLGFILIVNKLNIPNPMMILVIPVIYFTYSDGYINGLLSGITAIAYAAYFFLVEKNDPDGIVKMITIVMNVSTTILLLGKLKMRDKLKTSELMRLNNSLTYAATTDNLTGAMNRHAFWEKAQAIFEECTRLQKPVSVLFIDADHFKQVNDSYGHEFGDSVLSRISQIMTRCIRENDLTCRYGGEEFIAFLPQADCNVAKIVANRIMDEIMKTQFDINFDFHLTVSMGISCGVPSTEQNFNDIIRSADQAMYQAKQNGRNQIATNQINCYANFKSTQ